MSRPRTKSGSRTKARTLTPAVQPPAKKGADSTPGSFILPGALDSGDRDKWLSNMPVLNWLDVKTAQTCMDETIRGAYARTQWTYELMEQSDALLSAGVRRRRAALGKIPIVIVHTGYFAKRKLRPAVVAQHPGSGFSLSGLAEINKEFCVLVFRHRCNVRQAVIFRDGKAPLRLR